MVLNLKKAAKIMKRMGIQVSKLSFDEVIVAKMAAMTDFMGTDGKHEGESKAFFG